MQSCLEFVDLKLHDSFRAIGFHAAICHVRRYHLLQIVNIVDEDAVQLVHLRIDVAWDSDIDEEHGAIAATAQEALAVFLAEDRMGRAGRRDDDIGLGNSFVELIEWNCVAIEFSRQRDGAIVRAIGNVNFLSTMRQQMAGCQFRHLARANQVDALALKVPEDLLGEIDRNRRNRNS